MRGQITDRDWVWMDFNERRWLVARRFDERRAVIFEAAFSVTDFSTRWCARTNTNLTPCALRSASAPPTIKERHRRHAARARKKFDYLPGNFWALRSLRSRKPYGAQISGTPNLPKRSDALLRIRSRDLGVGHRRAGFEPADMRGAGGKGEEDQQVTCE